MIRYEFKKILKNKFIMVFIIIFIACDIFMIYKREYSQINYNKQSDWKTEQEYNQVKGIITNEKLDYAMSINPEELMYGGSEIYKGMVRALTYGDFAQEIYSKAKENAEFYKSIGREEQVYKNEKIAEAFREREIYEYYRQDGVDKYLTYDYSTFMVMIIVIIIVIILFFNDRNTGMYRLVSTSKYGHRFVRLVRMMTVLITGTVVMCFFRLLEYISYSIIYDFDGMHMPLYSVEEYAQTLFNGSIKDFIIIDIMLKCIGIMLFAMIFVALAKVIKVQGIALGIFIVVYLGTIIVSLKSETTYSPIRMFDGYSIIKSTEFIHIGNFFMSGMEYTILISAIIMAVMLCIIMVKGR